MDSGSPVPGPSQEPVHRCSKKTVEDPDPGSPAPGPRQELSTLGP